MAKDPAFLFYPNDWLGGTLGMTFEEKGAYMELLMLQFNRGHMTKHMMAQTVGHLLDGIQDKFTQDANGLWYNVRLEEEKIKRQAFTESRRNNKKGKNQYSKDKKNNGHMTSHMENENEDENVIDIKEELKSEIFSDKIFMDQLEKNHKGKNISQAFDECYLHHSVTPSSNEWQAYIWRQKLNTWLIYKNNENIGHNKKVAGTASTKEFSGKYEERLE